MLKILIMLKKEKAAGYSIFIKGKFTKRICRTYTKNRKIRQICHNDVYEPNYFIDSNGKLYLIDWEYAGLNNPLNDLACILCRGNYADEQIEQYFYEYYGRKLTEEEHRISVAYIALCGFYWF